MEIITVLLRTLLFYFIIAFVYRFMGKREVGELSIMDLIVSILIAELAAIAIDKHEESLLITIIPICVLVIIQIIVAKISLKSTNIREKIEGVPSIIINRGKINFKEMLKQRYNLDDLLTQLREKSIKSIFFIPSPAPTKKRRHRLLFAYFVGSSFPRSGFLTLKSRMNRKAVRAASRYSRLTKVLPGIRGRSR